MNKSEILEKLVTVCNALNSTTVTGIQNAANIVGSHSIIQEVINSLLSCDIVAPERQRDAESMPEMKRE